MKSKLSMKISALVWAVVLMAACTVAAQAQTAASSNPHPASKETTIQLTGISPAVTGTGTTGQLTKWTSLNGIGDSVISEASTGKIGIGTTAPSSKLTVAGVIESTTGGVKFPDGTVQTTAANKTNSPALQPYARSIDTRFPPSGGPAEAVFTVPAGKQWVIETISLQASLSSQNNFVLVTLNSTVGGETVGYPLFLNKVLTGSATTYGLTQPFKIYADPGTQVIATLIREAATDSGGFSLTLSGYLVDAQ